MPKKSVGKKMRVKKIIDPQALLDLRREFEKKIKAIEARQALIVKNFKVALGEKKLAAVRKKLNSLE
jgi:hypothetical protein